MDIPDTYQGSFATDIEKWKTKQPNKKKHKKTEKKTLKKEERLKKIKEIILAICKNFLFSTKVSNQESVTVETEILSKIQVPVKYTISIW